MFSVPLKPGDGKTKWAYMTAIVTGSVLVTTDTRKHLEVLHNVTGMGPKYKCDVVGSIDCLIDFPGRTVIIDDFDLLNRELSSTPKRIEGMYKVKILAITMNILRGGYEVNY